MMMTAHAHLRIQALQTFASGRAGETGLSHVRQAFDMTRPLQLAGNACRSRAEALDLLLDGIALIGADGTILHANESFHAMVRRRAGIDVQNNTIDLAASDARARLRAALDIACRLHDGDAGHDDFLVPRSGDAPAYVVSVRVLSRDDKPAVPARAV